MDDHQEQQEIQHIPVIETGDVPDIYVDGVITRVTPYGVTLYLQRQDADMNTMQPCNYVVGKLRMSHAQAWALTQILGRIIGQYVRDVGPVCLPEAMVNQLGLQEAYQAMQEETRRGDS